MTIAFIIAVLAVLIGLVNMYAIHLIQRSIDALLSVDETHMQLLEATTRRLTQEEEDCARAALDDAGPSVVIVKHAREPDPDTSGFLDGWKARAEWAEACVAELEAKEDSIRLQKVEQAMRKAEAHLSRHRYLEAHDLLRAALGE